MIQIRQEQLDALAAGRRADFNRRLVDHLRKHHAAETAPYTDAQMLDYADRCVDRAKEYGLTTERAVACYAQLHWVLGLNFEADVRCRYAVQMLSDASQPQNDRAKIALAVAHEFRARGV